MRMLPTLATALFLLPPAGRAEEALLRDGRRVPVTVTFGAGRLRLAGPPPTGPISPDETSVVRFTAVPPPSMRTGVVHQLLLPFDQRLSGELLSLDARSAVLRTPWSERLTVPRGAVLGLLPPASGLVVHDEDFEEGLKGWKLTGNAGSSPKLATSGRASLALDQAGQSATWECPAPVASGALGVNVHLPESAGGARWEVAADFADSADGAVRVGLAGPGDEYTVTTPVPRQEGVVVKRSPGWHRLEITFSPTSLLIAIDDRLLWFNGDRGAGPGLRRVRFSCVGDKPTGAVAFDEMTLLRRADALPRPVPAPGRDELWLAGGDQLFGKLVSADRREIAWEDRTPRRTWRWSEVRGVFPARTVRPPRTTTGELVRLRLHPATGPEPDELEGSLTALGAQRLTLDHPALGELSLPRERLRQLQYLYHGQRVEVDNGLHTLAAMPRRGRALPVEAAGLTRLVRLDRRPTSARLTLTVWPGTSRDARMTVLLNGQRVGDLERHLGDGVRAPRRVTLPLPPGAIQAGGNNLELRAVAGRSLVSDLTVEAVD